MDFALSGWLSAFWALNYKRKPVAKFLIWFGSPKLSVMMWVEGTLITFQSFKSNLLWIATRKGKLDVIRYTKFAIHIPSFAMSFFDILSKYCRIVEVPRGISYIYGEEKTYACHLESLGIWFYKSRYMYMKLHSNLFAKNREKYFGAACYAVFGHWTGTSSFCLPRVV